MLYPPIPWLQFLKRKDNIGLPLMEVKRKYLKEQLEFDDYANQQRLVIRGETSKGEVPFVDDYVGLERYRDYPDCKNNKAIDLFPQDFGSKYVTGISTISNEVKRVSLTDSTSLGRSNPFIDVKVDAYNPAVHNGQDWGLEVVPQWQGRPNVLKISIPPGLGKTNSKIRLELNPGSGTPERGDLKDTHEFDLAMGMWADGFTWNNNTTQNWHFSGGGSSDLLIFLAELASGDPLFGNYVVWEGNKWNDNRTINETIIQGPSPGNTFAFNYMEIVSEDLPLDPNLYGPQFDWYFSDINFRVCPL